MKEHLNGANKIFESFIVDFVRKDKQDRLSQFLAKRKNWRKLINEFHTTTCFDPNKLVEIKPNEQYADVIYLKMKELGAPESCISLLDYIEDEEYEM